MNYTVYVRTRSWRGDYRWIGAQPVEWWKSHPRGSLVLNTTGILKNGSRLILTGITGQRQDFAGTPIRYDIAIEPDPNGVLSDDVVRALLSQFWTSRSGTGLGVAFDRALGADGNANIDADSTRVTAAVVDVIKGLPRTVDSALSAEPSRRMTESWIGADNPDALNAILDSEDVLYSALLNSEVRDELLARRAAECLIVEGEDGLGPMVTEHVAQQEIGTRSSGGCMALAVAVVGISSIAGVSTSSTARKGIKLRRQ